MRDTLGDPSIACVRLAKGRELREVWDHGGVRIYSSSENVTY